MFIKATIFDQQQYMTLSNKNKLLTFDYWKVAWTMDVKNNEKLKKEKEENKGKKIFLFLHFTLVNIEWRVIVKEIHHSFESITDEFVFPISRKRKILKIVPYGHIENIQFIIIQDSRASCFFSHKSFDYYLFSGQN